MRFYTSDLHFGHRNIIRYCGRPYADIDEMREQLILKWNKRVRPDDEVFILGDFAFLKPPEAQTIFDRLHGKKNLVMGNHDYEYHCDQIKGWESVHDLLELSDTCHDGGRKLVLCHYAFDVWHGSHKGRIHLHGHSHGTLPPRDNRRIDVGVDCWDYAPCTLDEILARLKTYPEWKHADHHKERP